MTFEELHRLLEPKVQEQLALHCKDDPAAFSMRFHDRRDLPVRAMAEQIACRIKALKKLSSLSAHGLIYTSLALEQCTSEQVAAYRASFMDGARLIDMSGGLGIDTMQLSGRFGSIDYCERDEVLCAVAAYNFKKAGISNVKVHHADSVDFLAFCDDDRFDWIFVDPARREQGRRSVGLQSASPDVTIIHDLMLRKAPRVCIKASPALEMKGLEILLPSLSLVAAVSLGGECRELLLLLDRGHIRGSRPGKKAVCLGQGPSGIIEIKEDIRAGRVVAGSVRRYLFEPDPAIIKTGLASTVAVGSGMEFLNGTVDYLTADFLPEQFPGRSFEVVDVVSFKPKSFRAFLEKHRLDIAGASVQRRDFPLSPDEIRKKFRIRENDRNFLFFTRESCGSLICIYGLRRLS